MSRGPASGDGRRGWLLKGFDELTPDELYEILRLRSLVFVVEQKCAYLDMDGYDRAGLHLFSRGPDGRVEAYLRLLPPGTKYDDPTIGRVVTHPDIRGTGAGIELMREGMARCADEFPGRAIRINAQRRLERFYQSFGFVTVSEPYDEDGIQHVEMVRGPG